MTGAELYELFALPEFVADLNDMSSYLASIMQERPIVNLLAKQLWKRGYKFELENNKHDLDVDGKRIEFKFQYDWDQEKLSDELVKCDDDLELMWATVQAKTRKNGWSPLARLYEDVCVRKPKPDIFVWILCSRDLSNVAPDNLERICWWKNQVKYNEKRGYAVRSEQLVTANKVFRLLGGIRPFSLLQLDIPTEGIFPSTYHFGICEFASESVGAVPHPALLQSATEATTRAAS
jgi:hypothetical protein